VNFGEDVREAPLAFPDMQVLMLFQLWAVDFEEDGALVKQGVSIGFSKESLLQARVC
jgi:hypothetical protein